MRRRRFDRRIIVRFLFFPRTIGHETRWLEFAKIKQFYHQEYFYPWVDEEWVD